MHVPKPKRKQAATACATTVQYSALFTQMGVKAPNFYATFLFSDGSTDFARACMAMSLSYLGMCWSRGAPEIINYTHYASADAQYDVHPDFSTTISPVGSIAAVRFVFHLFLLLPLVNNHTRLLFVRSTMHDTVPGTQLCSISVGLIHFRPFCALNCLRGS